MKEKIKRNKYEIVFSLFTIAAMLNVFCLKIDIWFLNENQILYIYSALAQVIGALLGITIAGYAVVDQKNKKMKDFDDSVEEYIDRISENQYQIVKRIIWLSISALVLCFGVLSSYRLFDQIVSFGMVEAMILFGMIIFALLDFSRFLSPDTIKKMSSKDTAMYDEVRTSLDEIYSFSRFITLYNQMEETIKYLSAVQIDRQQSLYKIQTKEAMMILLNYEIISQQTNNVIQDIRMYRNALVHSASEDKNVNSDMYERLKDILFFLTRIKESIVKGEDYSQYTEELSEYVANLKMTKVEERILEYIREHQSSSLAEISEYLAFSSRATLSGLYQLMGKNKVTKVGNGRHTKWQYNESE